MDKTYEDLEWRRLLDAIRQRCVAPGAEDREVPLAQSISGARTALAETAEAFSFLTRGDPVPLEGIRDVRPSLSRIAREGSLDGPGLRDVRLTLEAASVLRKYLGNRRQEAPTLHAACGIDPTLDRLAEEIAGAIEPDGSVSDRASPELRRLRTEVHNLRARLVSRLEEMIHKNAAILSDRFYTIRDGRYVLPLRTDAHESFPGIVHGTSASGATLFVEPRGVINQGNRLKVAQAEMEREETRILALLSDRVRERLAESLAAIDSLEHADLRNAMARLGRDFGGRVLSLSDTPEVRLLGAKHPLLVLDGVDVVANDVSIPVGSAMIVSGPNAGGKTVALKVLGLFALMVRAGVPVPADEGSAIGFFDPILTDVGDDQSIEKNLSTFSAHVRNLAGILGQTAPGALILLDELAGGTDPAEGAALACALVEALVSRGGLLVATTHYEQLKAFASAQPRLRNASVGFDVERLLPTFELIADVPGASSALSVAARFGIGDAVIARARAILPEQARDFATLSQELGAARADLDAEKRAISEERRTLAETQAMVEQQHEILSGRDAARLSDDAETLRRELIRARDEVREARKSLKNKSLDREGLAVARKDIEEAARRSEGARETAARPIAAPISGGLRPISPEALEVGARVYVPRLNTHAQILEAPRRGQVKVAAGVIRLTVHTSELRAPATGTGTGPATRRRTATGSGTGSETGATGTPAHRTSDNTLDLRGLRVDEALGMTDSFVDRLYGASEPHAFIVHGHGTGALKDAVRSHLARDETYVRTIRAGTREEGGDAITVVTLR